MKSTSKSSTKIRHLSWSEIFTLVKRTFIEFFQENSFFHGAALAYYTIFAIVPILYLAMTIFGAVMGHDEIVKIIDKILTEQVGMSDSSGLLAFLDEVNFEKSSTTLNVVGIIALMVSSSAVISSLRTSINDFYDIEVKLNNKRTKVFHTLLTRVLSIFMLTIIGFSIIVLYTGETVFMSMSSKLYESLNLEAAWLLKWVEDIATILINMIIFALVFKYIHDGKVLWKLAFAGGLLTSVLLYFGQLGLKYYLYHYFFGSKMGIAGTLLIILAWMYYSSQIIFLGAKFIKVYSDMIGKSISFEVHRLIRNASGQQESN